MRSRQRGVTVLGMFLIAALIVFFATISLKLVPAYVEYATLRNHLRELARAPDTRAATDAEIRAAFGRRAQVDNITVVNARDLEIERDGGDVSLYAVYSQRIKLVGNVNACLDFEASSN